MVVYFIKRSSDGAIKIGYTECLKSRINHLKISERSCIEILCVIDGGIPIERAMQKQFKQFNLCGEWFNPAKDLLDFIDSMQSNSLDINNILKISRNIHIQIPVTEEEFNQIDSLKEREQSWRDYALPRLLGTKNHLEKS